MSEPLEDHLEYLRRVLFGGIPEDTDETIAARLVLPKAYIRLLRGVFKQYSKRVMERGEHDCSSCDHSHLQILSSDMPFLWRLIKLVCPNPWHPRVPYLLVLLAFYCPMIYQEDERDQIFKFMLALLVENCGFLLIENESKDRTNARILTLFGQPAITTGKRTKPAPRGVVGDDDETTVGDDATTVGEGATATT